MYIDDVKEYVNSFGIFGEPVEYKGLKIKPITMEDAHRFNVVSDLLRIKKNELGSAEIIQMSYLLFLLEFVCLDQVYLDSLLWVFGKTLGAQQSDEFLVNDYPVNVMLCKQTDDENRAEYQVNGWDIWFEVIGKKATMHIGDEVLNASEFDEVRRILLYQNIYGFDDKPMSDDVRRVMEQYAAIKNKGIVPPTLEEKMMVIISSSSENRESIRTMPMRQFDLLFETIHNKTEYMATMPLIPHLKNPSIEHWIYKKEKDKFANVFSDAQNIGKTTTRK